MAEQVGLFKVIATIKQVMGECSFGHKVGDKLELDSYGPGGLCGSFYQDIFHYINMLQFESTFPWGDLDKIELECSECKDKGSIVTIELSHEEPE